MAISNKRSLNRINKFLPKEGRVAIKRRDTEIRTRIRTREELQLQLSDFQFMRELFISLFLIN